MNTNEQLFPEPHKVHFDTDFQPMRDRAKKVWKLRSEAVRALERSLINPCHSQDIAKINANGHTGAKNNTSNPTPHK